MRTTALWYAIGVLVIVGGVAASIAGTIAQLKNLEASFIRFVVPGVYDLQVTHPGPYMLYYEYHTVVNGHVFDTSDFTDITCKVADPSGSPVGVTPSALDTGYEFGGHAGKAIGQFVADRIGKFVITCAHQSGTGDRVALAVAPPLGGSFASSILKLVGLAFASIGAGLAILIAALVTRPHPKRPVFET